MRVVLTPPPRGLRVALMKIVIAVLLVIAFVSAAFGTWWSTRPVLTIVEDGLYRPHLPENWWQANRGALGLGIGLTLTTIAGLLALTL